MKTDAVEAVECVKSWRKSSLVEGSEWILAKGRRDDAEAEDAGENGLIL